MRSGRAAAIGVAALALGLAAVGLASCADPGPLFGDEPDTRWPGQTRCTEPRPQVCTYEHRPVCGRLEGGTFRTYSNACLACSSGNVTSWTAGRCAGSAAPPPPPERRPPGGAETEPPDGDG